MLNNRNDWFLGPNEENMGKDESTLIYNVVFFAKFQQNQSLVQHVSGLSLREMAAVFRHKVIHPPSSQPVILGVLSIA